MNIEIDKTAPILVIVGNGDMPKVLITEMKKQNIPHLVVNVFPEVDKSIVVDKSFLLSNTLLDDFLPFIKEHNIRQVTIVGTAYRSENEYFNVFDTLGNTKSLGDGQLSKLAKDYATEVFGVELIPFDFFLPNLLAKKGCFTDTKNTESTKQDIDVAYKISKTVEQFDIGQAYAIRNQRVVAIEGPEGTDEMLLRVGNFSKFDEVSGILFKTAKKGQTREADWPVIGIQTVVNTAKAKLSGIVFEEGQSLIIDYEGCVTKANELGIFLLGLENP